MDDRRVTCLARRRGHGACPASLAPAVLDRAAPESAAETVKKVLGAVDVPIIVWGTANVQKDEDVLKKVKEMKIDYSQGYFLGEPTAI